MGTKVIGFLFLFFFRCELSAPYISMSFSFRSYPLIFHICIFFSPLYPKDRNQTSVFGFLPLPHLSSFPPPEPLSYWLYSQLLFSFGPSLFSAELFLLNLVIFFL